MYDTIYALCPSYGVMIPICSGLIPDLKNLVAIFSTVAASVLVEEKQRINP